MFIWTLDQYLISVVTHLHFRHASWCTRGFQSHTPREASHDVQCYPPQRDPARLQEVHESSNATHPVWISLYRSLLSCKITSGYRHCACSLRVHLHAAVFLIGQPASWCRRSDVYVCFVLVSVEADGWGCSVHLVLYGCLVAKEAFVVVVLRLLVVGMNGSSVEVVGCG